MRTDRWLGPLIGALALGWLVLVYLYIPGARNPGEPGPRGFPVVLGCALLGLGLLISWSGWSRGDAAAQEASDTVEPMQRRELRIVLGTFALLLLYAFLMEKTGFLISTPIVLVLVMAGILGMRNWRFIVLMTSGTTLVCWLVFAVLLRVPMPQGSWLWLL